MKKIVALILLLSLVSCASPNDEGVDPRRAEYLKEEKTLAEEISISVDEAKAPEEKELLKISDYKGEGHIFNGEPKILEKNLYELGDREAGVAELTCLDGQVFKVPADTHYLDESVPFARDLYNPRGTMYEKSEVASISYENLDAYTIDEDGEVITAYIFANNYFEMYVNGILIAKDRVPYTPYNSALVKFKVKRPFHVAFRVVDWEEDLGFAREANKGMKHMPGEGGIVFAFKKGLYDLINISDDEYRVQTFYTSPIEDLSLFKESGVIRDSSAIELDGFKDEKAGYGIFWDMPKDVFSPDFDDSAWQLATEYSTEDMSVDELPAYSNFRDIFDTPSIDAKFIWTNNLYLDNDVVIRGIVE